MNPPKLINLAIAEDQDFIRDVCVLALENTGKFQVAVVASDGLELIQKLILTPVDIILLDIQMPIMNGDEVLKYLLKSEKKSKIVIYSSIEDEQVIKSYIKRGVYAFITKKRELSELPEILEKVYLSKKGQRETLTF